MEYQKTPKLSTYVDFTNHFPDRGSPPKLLVSTTVVMMKLSQTTCVSFLLRSRLERETCLKREVIKYRLTRP